jgi:hypothetical protein
MNFAEGLHDDDHTVDAARDGKAFLAIGFSLICLKLLQAETSLCYAL